MSLIEWSEENISSLDSNMIKDFQDNLKTIFGSIRTCGTKMDRAAKFIDFFIHDILDYTILNKKDKNFEKSMTVIDIREAV
jgi:hypothetical protein